MSSSRVVSSVLPALQLARVQSEVQRYLEESPHSSYFRDSPFTAWVSKLVNGSYGVSKRRTVISSEVEAFLPACKKLYYHYLPSVVSDLLGRDVFPLPIRGTMLVEVHCYQEPGDTIGWHTDATKLGSAEHKVFTCVLCLENSSTQKLCVTDEGGVRCYEMTPGDIFLFEHFSVCHATLPALGEGEKRTIVTMVFAEHPYYDTLPAYVHDLAKNVSAYPLTEWFRYPAFQLNLLLVLLAVAITAVATAAVLRL